MKKVGLVVLGLAVLYGIVGCGPRAAVIPASRLSDIYADMFLADQWVNRHPSVRSRVDTMLLYDAVFEKYGYSRADYYKSLDHYLDRPEEFQKITAVAAEKLRREYDALRKFIAVRDSVNRLNAPYLKHKEIDFDADSIRWDIDVLKYLDDKSKHIIEECHTQKSTDSIPELPKSKHTLKERHIILDR